MKYNDIIGYLDGLQALEDKYGIKMSLQQTTLGTVAEGHNVFGGLFLSAKDNPQDIFELIVEPTDNIVNANVMFDLIISDDKLFLTNAKKNFDEIELAKKNLASGAFTAIDFGA